MDRRRWQDISLYLGRSPLPRPGHLGVAARTPFLSERRPPTVPVCEVGIVIRSAAALASYRLSQEWSNLLNGIWLIASPWILHDAETLICGVLFVVLGKSVLCGTRPSEGR